VGHDRPPALPVVFLGTGERAFLMLVGQDQEKSGSEDDKEGDGMWKR
jgi:hypothetical protein